MSRNYEKAVMRYLAKNKKGQIVNTMSGTALSIMVLIFIVFAVLFGIATLNPSGFFTAGSDNALAVGNLTANLTKGVSELGGQIPNTFKILAIVLVLGAIALLVIYIKRMSDIGGGSNAGL